MFGDRTYQWGMCLAAFLVFAKPVFASGIWEKAASLPEGRTEVAVASAEGKIYVVGGFSQTGVTSRVLMFDPATGNWEDRAVLPIALHHAAAASIDGILYVLGGFSGSFSWTPSNRVFAYDAGADRWEEKKSLPTARGALGAGVWKGKLYAVGGLGQISGRLRNVDSHEVYDPKSDQWVSKAPLPEGRDHLTVAVVDGKLSAIGGRLGSDYRKNMARHDVYHIKTDRWVRAAPLPAPRSGTASAVLNGLIFVLGGEGAEGTFSDNDVYFSETDQWKTASPLPTARHGLGAAVVDGKMYAVAGGPKPGGSLSRVNEVFQMNDVFQSD